MILLTNKIERGKLEKLKKNLEKSSIYFKEIKLCNENLLFVSENIDKKFKEEIEDNFSSFILKSGKEYELVSKKEFCKSLKIDFKDTSIGGNNFEIIAGPCAIESKEMAEEISKFLSNLNVKFFRGSLFKPRTSPHTFQGLGEKGIEILKEIKEKYEINIVVEPLNLKNINKLMDVADLFQIGSRNMQNFSLLKEAGESKKPIILKRGMSANLKEFLLAAEHILYTGNEKVILCERGIRTFSNYSRNTLDLSIVPILKKETYLPVIVDPSHGTGRRDIILPMVLASIVSGADGVEIEVHPNPEMALSDGPQSLTMEEFKKLHEKMKKLLSFYKTQLN